MSTKGNEKWGFFSDSSSCVTKHPGGSKGHQKESEELVCFLWGKVQAEAAFL